MTNFRLYLSKSNTEQKKVFKKSNDLFLLDLHLDSCMNTRDIHSSQEDWEAGVSYVKLGSLKRMYQMDMKDHFVLFLFIKFRKFYT